MELPARSLESFRRGPFNSGPWPAGVGNARKNAEWAGEPRAIKIRRKCIDRTFEIFTVGSGVMVVDGLKSCFNS